MNNDRTRTRNVNSEDDRAYKLVDIAEEVSGRNRTASRREYLAIKREVDDVEVSLRPEFLDAELGDTDLGDADLKDRSLTKARHPRAAVADEESEEDKQFEGEESTMPRSIRSPTARTTTTGGALIAGRQARGHGNARARP